MVYGLVYIVRLYLNVSFCSREFIQNIPIYKEDHKIKRLTRKPKSSDYTLFLKRLPYRIHIQLRKPVQLTNGVTQTTDYLHPNWEYREEIHNNLVEMLELTSISF